ncbi:MAG: aminoglycoside phosphotransferase [Oleiphilus sp.]|nr:MAG: aminoglycoside phosphotransferase [Oleiphilus sp.]
MDARQETLTQWCAAHFSKPEVTLRMVSGDASFRRYFRCSVNGRHYIVMDAPPDKEDSESFVQIATHWHEAGIHVPTLIAIDLNQGFLLLEDFGDHLLLNALNPDQPDTEAGNTYYGQAIQELLEIQQSGQRNVHLPDYDTALLQREMDLFRDWLLEKKLGLILTPSDHDMLTHCEQLLIRNALEQPTVPVHRDYHSRNLMITETCALGVLDFQDAVLGPISYDLVSLLRDCYIVWPDSDVERWCRQYHQDAIKRGLLNTSFEQFYEWFDLMGLQRHLKAAGIFARLSLRDGKHAYLEDIPRTLDYLCRIAKRRTSTRTLGNWIETRVMPVISEHLSTGT